ncbi:hypothetical protein EBZ39_02145 [bacterium]|nr:hypothetical protein [bacterium]
MATADLWEQALTGKSVGTQVPKNVQAERDTEALQVIQGELRKAQDALSKTTDPQQKARLQGDVNALLREISAKSKNAPTAAPAPAAPAALAFSTADMWEKALTGQAIAEAPTESVKEKSEVQKLKEKFFQNEEKAKTTGPAFLASAADVVANLPSAIAGTGGYWAGRAFGLTDKEATESSQKLAGAIANPIGRLTGLAETQAYKESLPSQAMEFIGGAIKKGAEFASEKTGISPTDIEQGFNALTMALPFVKKPAIQTTNALKGNLANPLEMQKAMAVDVNLPPSVRAAIAEKTAKGEVMTPQQVQVMQSRFEANKAQLTPPKQTVLPATSATIAGTQEAQRKSLGAAAVPDEVTIKQALSVATPELQKALSAIPVEKTNVPTFMRHIEADSLPVPVRLTRGQATGDIVKLSNEQNRRGKDPELAQRFNEQNGQLIENLGLIREKAAPDVYGTKTIENSQGIIDAYKALDETKNTDIRAAYKALEDANGGQFPVDGATIAKNAEAALGKKLKTEFLPPSIAKQLERFKTEPMTFEQFEAMRTNLASEIRKAERSGDGNAAQASSIVRQALEDLPLQGGASALKPLADKARTLAKARFDLLKKDPAYKAAVDDAVPADKFIDKFVVNGVNKNIQTMVNNLGKDSPAHQHMAAGTINWLTDKAGIVDGQGNFTQKGYNTALKRLDDVKNVQEIFNPETASQLKTLGNVARYTQAQPRGAFVNNSNTLVGALAEKAGGLAQAGIEKGLNVAVPGLQLGTSVMEMRARRAAEAETRKALELGAGTKQTGKNKLSEM